MRCLALISILALLLGSFVLIDDVSGTDPVNLVDHEDDVEMTTEVKETVSGWKDIDLLSLSSVEDGSEIRVTMTVEGNINSGSGYKYEIWMWYDYVFYTDGRFEFDRDIEDGVDAEVSGSSIIFTIELSALSDSYWDLSGEAYYFTSDDKTPGYESEYYHDSVDDTGDSEWFRSSSGEYNTELEDEKEDVEHLYSDVTRTSDRSYMDIVSLDVVIDSNNDYIFTLTLKGDVKQSSDLTYRFGSHWVEIEYDVYGGQIDYDLTDETTEEVTVKDNTITAIVDGSKIGEIRNYFSRTEDYDYDFDTGESLEFEDSLTNYPIDEDYVESYMIQYLDQMDMKMDFEFNGLDEAVLEISMDYSDGSYVSELRYNLDKNLNGLLDADEINEDDLLFFKDDIDNNRFGLELKLDGIIGETTVTYGMEGLLGSINDESGFSLTAVVTYSFDVTEKEIHKIELRSYVENKDDGSGYDEWDDFDYKESYNITDIGNLMDLRFVTPVGWRIQTTTVQPTEMSNFVNDQRNMVRMVPYHFIDILEPEVELISFDIKLEGGDGWDDLPQIDDGNDDSRVTVDDDEEKKDDSPMPFWASIVSILLLSIFILSLNIRKR